MKTTINKIPTSQSYQQFKFIHFIGIHIKITIMFSNRFY